MVKLKTADLTGAALDWAVAKVEGRTAYSMTERDCGQSKVRKLEQWCAVDLSPVGHMVFAPSTNPAQGQPILEREGIAIRRHSNGIWYAMLSSDLGDGTQPPWNQFTWRGAPAGIKNRRARFTGPTMLIAGLRCFVASKLGDEVDVPEELLA